MNRLSVILGVLILVFVVLTCNALQAYEEDSDEGLPEHLALTQPLEEAEDEPVSFAPSAAAKDIGKSSKDTTFIRAFDSSLNYVDTLLEIPAPRSDIPSQILHRKGYTVSYNQETKQPNWVAWHLTAEHTDGKWARPSGNAFHEDTDVPSPRASNYDYKGSGWSRGHMCPAGDNRWDDVAMYESFLLTNVCPQHYRLNSGDWNDIEQECRRWAKMYGGLYIVCGPIFYHQEHEVIGNNNIPVPEAFFKVVLCLNGKPKGIGFICKNTDGNQRTDFYVNTIQQVERITGYCFFPQLVQEHENKVKAEANLDQW